MNLSFIRGPQHPWPTARKRADASFQAQRGGTAAERKGGAAGRVGANWLSQANLRILGPPFGLLNQWAVKTAPPLLREAIDFVQSKGDLGD